MLQHIQGYKITALNIVPPIAVLLAKHPSVKDYDLTSVFSIGCGAAPLGQEVSAEVEGLFPEGVVNLKQVLEVRLRAAEYDLLTYYRDGE